MGHLIHRQILQLTFASQEDAQHWTPRFSELNQQIILSELERAFSEVSADQTVRIDRLEIDLGKLRQGDLEDELKIAVQQKIREALQPYLQVEPDWKSTTDALPESARSETLTTAGEGSLDTASLHELFEQFLRSGQTPWWLKRELVSQLDTLYQLFWQLAPEVARSLILQTIYEPFGLVRFVEQFSNRSHQLTLQQLLPDVTEELLIDLRKLATHLLARQGFGLQARVLSLKLVYGLIAVNNQQQLERPQALARQFLFTLTQISGISVEQLHEEIDGAVARLRLTPATKAMLAKLLREDAQQKTDRELLDSTALEEIKGDEQRTGVVETVDVSIENAGLVLLWPHLREIFAKLELLETLADGSQRPKVEAALLLQQLVTGRPSGQENLLLLNKLLCGIPLSLPIPRRRRRSPQWDAEVEMLLTVVIKQWAALKNTSVAGLRSGFLQREGILREQGQGWVLQVERKSQDILFEQLPWGLGMIQFSWMRQPLQVEW